MGCFCIHIFYHIGRIYLAPGVQKETNHLAGDRVQWLSWLSDPGGDSGDREVDDNGQQSGEQRGERVVHTTVLVDLDDLVHQPADEVHPREGGREGEARNDGVQGLRFKLLADKRNSFGSGHGIYYI